LKTTLDLPASQPGLRASPLALSSIHTHTLFCDGRDNIEEMCRAAFEKGLCAVGFSAHAPVEKAGLKTDWHLKEERLSEYAEEVGRAKARWQGRLSVFLGLELDYIRGLRCARDADIQAFAPDYIISSVHYLIPPKGEPFTIDGPAWELEKGLTQGFGGDSEALAGAYWDAVIEMAGLGGFDIVGHLDLIKKHSGFMPGKAAVLKIDREGAFYTGRAQEAARAIAAAGLIVEVNTGGMNRGHFNEPCPSPAILRLLREHGAKVLLSADAHKAGDIDGHYEQGLSAIADAGFAGHILPGEADGKLLWREQFF